jgi:hypothetical protein
MDDKKDSPSGWIGWSPLSGEPEPPGVAEARKSAREPIAWVKVEIASLGKGQCRVQVWSDSTGELKGLKAKDSAERSVAYQTLWDVLQRELPEALRILGNPPAWPSE